MLLSLSENTILNLLKDSLDFHGLVFTDGLEMKGVTKYFGNGEVEANALIAGNDILLLPESIVDARAAIQKKVASGDLSQKDLDRKVKRVLRAKYRLGLTHYTPLPDQQLLSNLNTPAAIALKEQLVEAALTLVRNEGSLVPIHEVGTQQIASLAIGATAQTPFQQRLLDYAPVDLLRTSANISTSEEAQLLKRLEDEDLVIVSLHNMGKSSSDNFGIQRATVQFLEKLKKQNKVILVVFGNPYSLKNFDNIGVVLEAYNEDSMTQDKAAQALMGAVGLNGRLPVTASATSPYNAGVSTSRSFRMGYSVPERVGMDSDTLHSYLAQLAEEAIQAGATPGCVVLVARHGKIVYHEAFGYHTYDKSRPVRKDDIYDLASITKVAATSMAIMDLEQQGRISIDETLEKYLPELAGTNKEALIIRDILAHRAALKPWIPFYTATLDEKGRRTEQWYSAAAGGDFNVRITNKLYLQDVYLDSIWYAIDNSELRGNNNYRYSDLGFYYLARLVQNVTGKSLDQYMEERFYEPLGLYNIGFNPVQSFSLNRIPPTENDTYWRKEKVQGFVHDMGAAMLGGVSGHAGLFANAHDLAVLGQLWLQRGIYANHVWLKPEIVREFTHRYPNETRRGLGFDMKQLDTLKSQNVSELAGPKVFGHLGFTGTSIWADPDEELLFVFLSNRTWPSMNNGKLNKLNIRPRMQTAVYRSITQPVVRSYQVTPIETLALPDTVESHEQ
ncbi:MAG: serine hydrolase [Saprospiraceae bacterium]